MTATVTFLPGVLAPDQRQRNRKAEMERREAGRCTEPGCGELPPNHRVGCGRQRLPADGGPCARCEFPAGSLGCRLTHGGDAG